MQLPLPSTELNKIDERRDVVETNFYRVRRDLGIEHTSNC